MAPQGNKWMESGIPNEAPLQRTAEARISLRRPGSSAPLMSAVKKAHVLHMLLDFRDQEGKNV